jgi:hypothetical protein
MSAETWNFRKDLDLQKDSFSNMIKTLLRLSNAGQGVIYFWVFRRFFLRFGLSAKEKGSCCLMLLN